MKSIKDILKENGVELEEEALKKVESGVLENYRSKTETEAKAAKVKELEAQRLQRLTLQRLKSLSR